MPRVRLIPRALRCWPRKPLKLAICELERISHLHLALPHSWHSLPSATQRMTLQCRVCTAFPCAATASWPRSAQACWTRALAGRHLHSYRRRARVGGGGVAARAGAHQLHDLPHGGLLPPRGPLAGAPALHAPRRQAVHPCGMHATGMAQPAPPCPTSCEGAGRTAGPRTGNAARADNELGCRRASTVCPLRSGASRACACSLTSSSWRTRTTLSARPASQSASHCAIPLSLSSATPPLRYVSAHQPQRCQTDRG